MNQDYRIVAVRELRDQQVRFAPREKRLEQANRAERLMAELDRKRDYPFDFLFYRVTEVRPEQSSRIVVKGEDAAHDLRLFVEDITDSMNIRIEEAAEPVHTVEELSKLFKVSTKTIARWRDQGLVSRRFVCEGRKRVGFLHSSVERFVSENRSRVDRGERFSQMSEDEKTDIVMRARYIAAEGCSLSEVARRLAREMDRSIEAMRYTLKNFDRRNPEIAIFPDLRPQLTPEEVRAIYQQHLRNVSTVVLARRYNRTRSAIVRLINEQRAVRIMDLPLDFMPNPQFADESLEEQILGEMPASSDQDRRVKAPSGLPLYLASLYNASLLTREQEQHLFRKMNYLKQLASNKRELLNVKSPNATLMNEIDAIYHRAVEVKNQLVQSNLRLVVSIAKRHASSGEDFFSLISDGNISLIRAVEKFDFARGNKFSTYASWAIMKNFARSIPDEFKHRDRFRTSSEETFATHEDSRADNVAAELEFQKRKTQISRILHKLDQREQEIIIRRFGLNHEQEPLTLKQVGESLGVTKERIRQLEARALSKLKLAVSEEHIDQPD